MNPGPAAPSCPAPHVRVVGPARGTCRAIVEINGTPYVARPLPSADASVRRLYRLRKPDGSLYHVAQGAHGPECDCPDFIFHRSGLDPAGCKHIQALTAYGMLDPAGSGEGPGPAEVLGAPIGPSPDDFLRFGPPPAPTPPRASRRRAARRESGPSEPDCGGTA